MSEDENNERSPIDWDGWIPEIRATLMFVREGDQVLLIRKLRGIGAGKINAPGGKIDPSSDTTSTSWPGTGNPITPGCAGVKRPQDDTTILHSVWP